MAIFDRIFGRKDKEITSRDLKVALLGVKRDVRRKQMEMRRNGKKRGQLIERIRRARKDGSKLDQDLLYDELRGINLDMQALQREAKLIMLEQVALSRYMRGMERLERTGDKGKVRSLIDKIATSGLEDKLRAGQIDEAAYMDSLNAQLEEFGIELEQLEEETEEDEEKEKFFKEIDAINEAEDDGRLEEVVEREEKLKEKLDKEQRPEVPEEP